MIAAARNAAAGAAALSLLVLACSRGRTASTSSAAPEGGSDSGGTSTKVDAGADVGADTASPAPDAFDGGSDQDTSIATGGPEAGPAPESGVDAAADASSPDAPDVTETPDAATTSNVVPVIVQAQPPVPTAQWPNEPYVSVTFCEPGTMNCQTVDGMEVDTGASGVRVFASAISGLTLPQQTASTGQSLVECMEYVSGYAWGPVKLADVRIGGELAAQIPIQVLADPAFSSIPSSCSGSGSSENTIATFGAYGTIGINPIVADCGAACANANQLAPSDYYGCTGSTCSQVAVPLANQVSNPVAAFAKDNNGALLQFPSAPAAGAVSLAGSLTFGIGTESNNALGSAEVLTIDANAELTTVFDGLTMPHSYVDSGTECLTFYDTSVHECSSTQGSGYYCPASTLSLTAQIVGTSGATSSVSFSVANANTLFSNASYLAFGDLACPGGKAGFVWGLPFFMGRTVYFAVDGAPTSGGNGPYVAY